MASITLTSIPKFTTFLAGFATVAMLAGCGGEATKGADGTTPDPDPTPTAQPTTGTVEASYAFSGNEAPTKTRLLLIDGDVSGDTCSTLPFNPTAGIVTDRPNLPVNGSATFSNVVIGTRYLVVAIGEKTDGTRIAQDCRDQVNVLGGETTQVDLLLVNWIGDLNGVYYVDQNVNLGLPPDIQNYLLLAQAACGILNQPDLCTIVNDVVDVLTNLEVVSEWVIDAQQDGTFKGQIKWVSVEGLDVGSMDLVLGNFTGYVPGSTQIQYQDFNSTIQFGNLVLFIVEDVLGFDLGQFGSIGSSLITTLAGNYVSPMTFTGTGALTDADGDGVTEKIAGPLAGHIQVVNWQHDFALTYEAVLQ